MKVLVVVDMQNDFIDGALGTKEAEAILPQVIDKIKNFEGQVVFTQDTHEKNYSETQEGKALPVPHCIKDTPGWQLQPQIKALCAAAPIHKPTFGSVALGKQLKAYHEDNDPIESITLVGLCTDICVISNALLLKAYLPEVPIHVDAACCAGVTPESHTRALEAMKVCQILVENDQ